MFPIMEKSGHYCTSYVMWGVDDQIRELYKDFKTALENEQANVLEEFEVVRDGITRDIQSEENILIPMVEQVFHVDDWETIANQSSEYGYCIVNLKKNGRSKRLRPCEDKSRG